MDSAPKVQSETWKQSSKLEDGRILPNSLMVKGTIVTSLDDTILLDEFSKLGEVKDIRMIRD